MDILSQEYNSSWYFPMPTYKKIKRNISCDEKWSLSILYLDSYQPDIDFSGGNRKVNSDDNFEGKDEQKTPKTWATFIWSLH